MARFSLRGGVAGPFERALEGPQAAHGDSWMANIPRDQSGRRYVETTDNRGNRGRVNLSTIRNLPTENVKRWEAWVQENHAANYQIFPMQFSPSYLERHNRRTYLAASASPDGKKRLVSSLDRDGVAKYTTFG